MTRRLNPELLAMLAEGRRQLDAWADEPRCGRCGCSPQPGWCCPDGGPLCSGCATCAPETMTPQQPIVACAWCDRDVPPAEADEYEAPPGSGLPAAFWLCGACSGPEPDACAEHKSGCGERHGGEEIR